MKSPNKDIVRKSIAGILSPKGNIIGTGFFVGCEGFIITCYHVIEALMKISVRIENTGDFEATLKPELSVPECDIAVIWTGQKPVHYLYPTLDFMEGDVVWSTGYQFYGNSINSPFPTGNGKIEDAIDITFGGRQRYSLKGVLKISDGAVIEEGLSGAPLVLIEKGFKAMGLINAKFKMGGGFAFPFARATQLSSAFAAFLSPWTEEGEFIDRKTRLDDLAATFQNGIDDAIKRLVNNEQFLPEQYCQREHIETEILQFLDSGLSVFPLLGAAGTGKTSLLAKLATNNSIKRRLSVFISGYRLQLTGSNMRGQIMEQFDLAGMTRAEMNLLSNDLVTFSDQLLIIIDGINEVKIEHYNAFKVWFEDSMIWLADTRAKLIISCRPDFWETIKGLMPSKMQYLKGTGEPFKLENFDEKELSEALAAYTLPADLPEPAILEHPLLLRIYADTLKFNRQKNKISTFSILNSFIQAKCRRIADQTGKPQPFIRDRLAKMADLMLSRKDYWLTFGEFYQFSNGNPDIEQLLISENLFISDASSFRIVFDLLGEFLTGYQLAGRLPMQLDSRQISVSWGQLKMYSLRFAFAKLETEGVDLSPYFRSMALSLKGISSVGLFEWLFIDIFRTLKDPSRYGPSVVDFFNQSTLNGRNTLLIHSIVIYIEATKIKLDDQIDLIKIALINSVDYAWEFGYWSRLSTEEFIRNRFCGEPLATYLQTDDQAEFDYLTDKISLWLNDYTVLSNYEGPSDMSNINIVACGLLFHYRSRRFDKICQILAEHYSSNPRDNKDYSKLTLLEIANQEPLKVIPLIQVWFDQGILPGPVIDVIDNLGNNYDTSLDRIVLNLLSQFPDGSVYRGKCFSLLLRSETYFMNGVQGLIDGLEQDIDYGLNQLGPYLDQYFDVIFPVLSGYIKNGRDLYLKRYCINALFGNKVSEENQKHFAAMMSDFFKDNRRDTGLIETYAFTLEQQLNYTAYGSANYESLMETLRMALKKDNPTVKSLYFYLASNYSSSAEKVKDKFTIMNGLIKNTDFDSSWRLLEAVLSNTPDDYDTDTEYLVRQALKRFGDEFIRRILSKLSSNNHQHIRDIILQDMEFANIRDLARLKELLRQGNSFDEALDRLLYNR